MGATERLQSMREHFANITIEEFERNLLRAGIEIIRPASDDGYYMVCPEEEVADFVVPNMKRGQGTKINVKSLVGVDNYSYDNSYTLGIAA